MRYNRLLAIAGLTTGILTTGCSASVNSEIPIGAVALDVRELAAPLAQYHYSGYEERQRLVIRDAASMAQFWATLTAGVSPQPPVPAVDFSTEMVIVAAMGSRPSGGYSIHVDQVYERDGRVTAVVREVSPSASCVVTAALTTPVAAVRIPRRPGDVTFAERTSTRRCD